LWIVFIISLLTNSVLSFYRFSPMTAIFIGVALLAVPFAWLGVSGKFRSDDRVLRMDMGDVPGSLVVLLALGAILARLWQLTSLSGWPLADEGINAFFSMELLKSWNWKPLIGVSQHPAAFNWGEALVFKCLGPSLFSLWLYPALLSILTLGLIYWAARQFFDRSFALVCLMFSLFQYWLLWCGRLSEISLALPQEMLTLICAGWVLKHKKGNPDRRYFLLGAALALNFYMATSSIALALFAAMAFFLFGFKERIEGTPSGRAGFLIGFFLILAPLVYFSMRQGYGKYVNSLWFFEPSSLYENAWIGPVSNVTGIFWGARDSSLWGGFLNPLETSLVFMGGYYAFQQRHSPLMRWTLVSSLVSLLPGLASSTIEHFRVILIVPFLLVFCALGLGCLLTETRETLRGWLIGAVLILTMGLNLFHLFGPYHQAWGIPGPECSRFKSIEQWRAYDRLKEVSKTRGPGRVFFEFSLSMPDETIALAVCPFDAEQNPHLSAPKWVALITNAQWQDSLKRRFPKAEWIFLSEHLSMAEGGGLLGIIPSEELDERTLAKWEKAHEICHQVAAVFFHYPDKVRDQKIVDLLRENAKAFEEDRLLASIYWNKLEYFQSRDGNVKGAIEALRMGLKSGYRSFFFERRLKDLTGMDKTNP
jgi:hypothetical protein